VRCLAFAIALCGHNALGTARSKPGASPSPGPSFGRRRAGAFKNRREVKPPWVDAGLRELVGISLIAAGGCGLAFSQGDFLFAAILRLPAQSRSSKRYGVHDEIRHSGACCLVVLFD
jgi:hypothetical protein